MRKLLLLLPLILTTPVLAESDPLGLGMNAAQKFKQHLENALKFDENNDAEMMCSEFRMASAVLKTQFSKLQQFSPNYDWFRSRKIVKNILDEDCTPYGD